MLDRQSRRGYWALVLLPLAVLGVLYLYPLGKVLWLSVTVPTPGFGNYARLADSAALQRILWTTARICALTALIALVLGYLVAYVMLHVSARTRAWMLFLVLLSFWLSVLIRAFAWLALLQSRGLINSWLMQWGVIDSPLPLVRNELGVVIGMVHYMIPYAVLPLYANMHGIDPRLVPAARVLGASARTAFLRVYLPLSLPGILAAGILVFIFSLGFYVTPALLGGGKTVMVAEYISVLIIEALNWGTGSMLATSLLAVVFLLLLLTARLVGLRRVFGVR